MKLQNKKTGEIGNLVLNINPNRESYTVLSTENGDTICGNLVVGDYDTLAELNKEWEDYEEPHTWYINDRGYVILNEAHFTSEGEKAVKSIGNKFETEEEAEKAVEKLKALNKLRENGFKFDGWTWKVSSIVGMEIINIQANIKNLQTNFKDNKSNLDLLFGGEE